jgi:hypothetical protein
MKIISGIIVALLCIGGALALDLHAIISEVSFMFLLVFSVTVGFIIAFSDRIVFFSLKDLSVKLAEAKQTEKSIREISLAILDVIDKNSGFLALESFDQKALDEAKDRLRKLIA